MSAILKDDKIAESEGKKSCVYVIEYDDKEFIFESIDAVKAMFSRIFADSLVRLDMKCDDKFRINMTARKTKFCAEYK